MSELFDAYVAGIIGNKPRTIESFSEYIRNVRLSRGEVRRAMEIENARREPPIPVLSGRRIRLVDSIQPRRRHD